MKKIKQGFFKFRKAAVYGAAVLLTMGSGGVLWASPLPSQSVYGLENGQSLSHKGGHFYVESVNSQTGMLQENCLRDENIDSLVRTISDDQLQSFLNNGGLLRLTPYVSGHDYNLQARVPLKGGILIQKDRGAAIQKFFNKDLDITRGHITDLKPRRPKNYDQRATAPTQAPSNSSGSSSSNQNDKK